MEYVPDLIGWPATIFILSLVGLSILGGGYAAFRLIFPSRECADERHVVDEESICAYCSGRLHDDVPYRSWAHFAWDVRDTSVCLEHILSRCDGQCPVKPQPTEDILDERIEARLAEFRRARCQARP